MRMRGVDKRFGRVVALAGAHLEVAPGEVHAVLGENGAGKSTLLGVLGGIVRPDAGEVEVQGRAVRLRTPRDAWSAGVGLVHQHFTLVPAFTALENLALGWRAVAGEGAGGLHLPLEPVRERASTLAAETGLEVRLDAPVDTLGVGERQRVEILKVLLRDPRVLALDEPTATLAPAEVDRLLALLRHLAGGGRSVVLVAHKLDEVLSVADRVTVLRHGRTVLEAPRSEVDAPGLARVMVGESLAEVAGEETGAAVAEPPADAQAAGEVVARLDDVWLDGPRGEAALRGVTLEVRRGEIVGVAGVEGNGQRELALVLGGRERPGAGRARLPEDPAFVPQDRTREGLVGDFDLTSNLALALAREPAYRKGPFLRWQALRRRTEELLARYGVRAPSPDVPARALSGGNQQRVVVARELARPSDLVVAENPSRGLDVAGAAFVHATLRTLRDAGTVAPGVVLLSTDLDEVLALSDRVLVMVRGRLLPVPAGGRDRATVGALMLGGRSGEGPGPSVAGEARP